MELAQKIYRYYLDNQHLLSQDKLFHFGTRTAAWTGEAEAFDILRHSREYIIASDSTLKATLAKVYHTPPNSNRNANRLREPLFIKYPLLHGAHLALFRTRHMKEVYGIDASEDLFSIISKSDLIDLRDQLLNDRIAMKALSTFAVNYYYLITKNILDETTAISLEEMLAIGKTYDLMDIDQIQLMIYFYTHCIIGETNFYIQNIPETKLSKYQQMLKQLEIVIRDNYNDINLDNKLEFLVCAQICSFQTDLFEKIHAECDQSISPEGTFIIDIQNNKIRTDRNDFISSEHRNVLYIMSTTPYHPHSTLV